MCPVITHWSQRGHKLSDNAKTSEEETDEEALLNHSSAERTALTLTHLREATEGLISHKSFPSDIVASSTHRKTPETKTGETGRFVHFMNLWKQNG